MPVPLTQASQLHKHSIPIHAPIIIKAKTNKGENPESKLVGFKTAYVFDINQTEGEPLHEVLEWKTIGILETIHGRLLDLFASKGITVNSATLAHGAQGVSKGGTINLDLAAGTKTLGDLSSPPQTSPAAGVLHTPDPTARATGPLFDLSP